MLYTKKWVARHVPLPTSSPIGINIQKRSQTKSLFHKVKQVDEEPKKQRYNNLPMINTT
jgi:hypothetical protein